MADSYDAVTAVETCLAAQGAAADGVEHLVDREAALSRRFVASADACDSFVSAAIGDLGAECRLAIAECREAAVALGKLCDSAAEEARVRAAQLIAYTAMLCENDELEGAVRLARTLLAQEWVPNSTLLLTCVVPVISAEAALSVRVGIEPSQCVVSGAGSTLFVPTTDDDVNENVVDITAVDAEGNVVGSVEAKDVRVEASGTVTVIGVTESAHPGVLELRYTAKGFDTLLLRLNVCGSPLPPLTVHGPLVESVLLPLVPPDVHVAFLRQLTTAWLPGRVFRLLYRGSRDGMTPIAFHTHCDRRGPTLVLLRSENGYTFGGFTGVSCEWDSEPSQGLDPDFQLGPARWKEGRECKSAFLFSVVGPLPMWCASPMRLGGKSHWAIRCRSDYGPIFAESIFVGSRSGGPSARFQHCCYESTGRYVDVMEKGHAAMTGAADGYFELAELEVFSVSEPV